jgi:hypothetical protein
MRLRHALVRAVGIAWIASNIHADHLPQEKQALGKAEHVLAGVNVYKGKVADAVRRFGTPARIEDQTDSDYPDGSGEKTYHWELAGLRLQLATVYRTDSKRHAVIESPPQIVDVWGGLSTSSAGRTGAGLRLGQTLQDVIRVYGPRFQQNDSSVVLQWADDTMLVIDFDGSGRIAHMHLEASVE